jgi:serine/threonine-protein kinase
MTNDPTRRSPADGRRPPSDSAPRAGDEEGVDGPEGGLESLPFDDVDVAPSPSVFRTGEVVASRFRIVRYLAKGGMGELYEAEDLELHERVALKTILSKIAENERSILMFKREVHLARQVTHPNICRIFDVFRHRPAAAADAEGQGAEVVFLVMELLHGETLADRIQREGKLATGEALPLVRQMAAGLSAAHRVGVIHRDFKSQNVMLVKAPPPDQEVRVVITDFGLAQRNSGDDSSSLSISLNDAGQISGTPAYMAPEQVEGGPVTPATDVYALGVVIYEMITGVRPFVGDTPLKIAVKRLQEKPLTPRAHVPDLDPRWETTILRCLARKPADRFATAGEALAALEGQRVGPRATARERTRRALALLVAAAMVVGGAYLARKAFLGQGKEGITSLAVLPFANAGQDPEKEYLSDGISESLIRRLSRLPGMKVIANSSSSKYKGEQDPQEVARALGVTGILTGRVVQRSDDLSISVELMDARDRTQVWGEQYERKAADLLTLQTEISREIAEQLRIRLTAGQRQELTTHDVVNPKAYELLLQGRFHRSRGGTDDRRKAAEYFEQAIAVDPAYALAYAELSDINRSLAGSSTLGPKDFLPRAKAAAEKALELDQGLADAHYARANLHALAWEWTDAEREYLRAIELNPNLALAHRWYATFLALTGRHEQAIPEIRRARDLDPLSPGVNATVGLVLYFARQYDPAVEALKQTIKLDPSYPYAHLFLGFTLVANGAYAESIVAHQEAIRLGLDTPNNQARLGAALALAGERERAMAIGKRLEESKGYVSGAELAILYAALGERDQAFAALDKAHEAHDPQLQYLGVSPAFDPLRSDPRFREHLKRIGLTP